MTNSNFRIPGDGLSRSWVEVIWGEDEPSVKEGFGVLLAPTDDGGLMALGHAVVIWGNGDTAICLGAAHSFEPIKHRQNQRTAKGAYNVSPMFRNSGPEYINPDEIHAIFVYNGDVTVCKVIQISYQGDYDVAVFSAHAPDRKKIFQGRAAVDFGAPSIGDEVAIVANSIKTESQDEGIGQLELSFSMRFGVVTDVIHGKSQMLGQSFVVRTTIPVHGGMSGGALVKKPQHGENLVLLGIISADFSSPEAFGSFLVAGDSTASMLWPTLSLGLTAALEAGAAPRPMLLNEMRKTLFDDRTHDVEIAVTTTEQFNHIHYLDRRVEPPIEALLQMTAFPLGDRT